MYRAFRTRCHAVYEQSIDDLSILAIEQATTPYICWMLTIPTIFTKAAAPVLAQELSLLPYHPSLEALAIIIEAYPASYHHGAAPELGIIVSFNHAFNIGKQENQRNWKYTHVDIVDQNGARNYRLADLKSSKYPNKTYRPLS